MARKKKFKPSNSITIFIAIIIIAIALFYYYRQTKEQAEKYSALNDIFTSQPVEASTDVMKIHFIDVGQGDCIYIEFPDGKNMLIDSGNNGKEEQIIDYLNKLSVKNITLVLATHADADHIGGMEEIFEAYNVGFCLRPFVYYNGEEKSKFEDSFNIIPSAEETEHCKTKTYNAFLTAILEENCGYEYFNKDSDFSQVFTYQGVTGSYSVDFLTPTKSAPYIGYSDANDYSPIFTLTYGDFIIMLTGDAEKDAEAELLLSYPNLPDVDVLKVGHHGSETSTTMDLLTKIKPENAVIQSGIPNSYGHPRQAVLDRLFEVNATIYRTDLQGSIVIEVQSDGSYSFVVERTANHNDLLEGVKKPSEIE